MQPTQHNRSLILTSCDTNTPTQRGEKARHGPRPNPAILQLRHSYRHHHCIDTRTKHTSSPTILRQKKRVAEQSCRLSMQLHCGMQTAGVGKNEQTPDVRIPKAEQQETDPEMVYEPPRNRTKMGDWEAPTPPSGTMGIDRLVRPPPVSTEPTRDQPWDDHLLAQRLGTTPLLVSTPATTTDRHEREGSSSMFNLDNQP